MTVIAGTTISMDLKTLYMYIGCRNGAIKLSDGFNEFEGIVQICVNNIWGVITGKDWSTENAVVICHQLGYTESKTNYSGIHNHYGSPSFYLNR